MATSDDAFHRAEVIQVAADRAKKLHDQPAWSSIVYVGDGIWDLRAAKNLGCGFVGIASRDKAESLVTAGARHVMPDFAETDRFFDAIESASIEVD